MTSIPPSILPADRYDSVDMAPESLPSTNQLGGGDAFTAGVLHGTIMNWETQKILDFATAAFATTQTIKGDINFLNSKEILSVSEGNFLGHLKR